MSEQVPSEEIAFRALAKAANGFAQLLRYVVEDNWMHDIDAKHEAMRGMNECIKAMGEIERLF